MFWWIEVGVSCSTLSTAATYEHAYSTSSPTSLQLMGKGGKPREPRNSPDTPRPMTLEDPGAGDASPGAVHLEHQHRRRAPSNSVASS
jgi:hypothetical protein